MGDDLHDRIAQSFANQTMIQTLGATLVSAEPGCVVIEAPVGRAFLQQMGHAHAGFVFALGDATAGHAALSVVAPEVKVVTAEMKINYLAPATGDRLRATGRVIRPGRRLIVVTAEVHSLKDGTETLTAMLQGSIVPIAP